jgi:hypothetical protein
MLTRYHPAEELGMDAKLSGHLAKELIAYLFPVMRYLRDDRGQTFYLALIISVIRAATIFGGFEEELAQ